MNNRIEVQNLTKTYHLYRKKSHRIRGLLLREEYLAREFEALRGISFTVAEGECVGIIGLNGSGKSTLLKILSGVTSPTEGSVRIRGEVEALLELGAGFRPEDTGIKNVERQLMLRGLQKEERRRRMSGILAFAEIGDFASQPVRTYSTGMFVRLAFAAALSIDPEILLIDEALSVGDVFFQEKCFRRIRALSGKATVLMVSHDLASISRFCSRTLLLNGGVLVYDGDTKDAIAEYYRIRQGTLPCQERKSREIMPVQDEEMKIPEAGSLSGAGQIRITAYSWQVNGAAFREEVKQDDRIRVTLSVQTEEPTDCLITGFQVLDKRGMEVFGETNLTSGNGRFSTRLKEGKSLISFWFSWPELREGDYFMTLGIGTGPEVLCQTEQCWVNQAVHFVNSSSGRLIYGLFNRKMEEFQIISMEADKNE